MYSETLLKQILDELRQTNKLLQESNPTYDINHWVDNAGLARKLKISIQTIYRMRKNGVLKSTKIKGKIYFNLIEVEKTLTELQSK
jgi:hypothetical protein